MNVKIGAKIKELRKRDDVTQERLAEVLGVTSQAVSKWESGSGYPDIEYISPIANFFNVTTDYLFNHDAAEKNRKIQEYCEKCDIYARNCAPAQERIDIMRQALAEFPAEEKLLFLLAEALYDKWKVFPSVKTSDGWKEPAAIFERLLAKSADDSIRPKCRSYLAFIYGATGDKEKVLAVTKNCDPVCRSREVLLAHATRGNKDHEKYQQEAVLALLYSLEFILSNISNRKANHADKDDPLRDYIRFEYYDIIIDMYTKINKFLFKNSDCHDIDKKIIHAYCLYAYDLIMEQEIDEAYRKLDSAYNYAKNSDDSFTLLSSLLEELISETGSIRIPDDPQLRNDPRYTELIAKIQADIAVKKLFKNA